ncbi:MAG: hypothetical protein HKO64_02315 [Xanthomonadales bacterium]|nr:hypothetical protein [Xanthomonadales bacterium]
MPGCSGLSLVELLVALAASALLLSGLIQIAAAASASTQLQRNQAQMQENARLAHQALARAVHQAGFNPQPWNPDFALVGIAESTADGVSETGDRLVLRSWSNLNCFDSRNPEVDAFGNPLFYIRESAFDISSSRSLTHQCRYGPSVSELTTQIRRQGFINEIEAFQVLYGEDSDDYEGIDTWVRAGHWSSVSGVSGVRVALLLFSQDALITPKEQTLRVLDTTINKRADGKLRQVVEFTAAIKGRTG